MDEQAPLSSGIVTFLLTDVERSTWQWRIDPTRAAISLRRQRELIAQAATANHGVVPLEQGEGDSTVAVFSSPADAHSNISWLSGWLSGQALALRLSGCDCPKRAAFRENQPARSEGLEPPTF